MRRLPAKKVRIYDIVNGKYFPGSRETMQPSFLITPLGQRISRVNVVATVTDKFLSEDETYSTITVDDGTESVRIKMFGEDIKLAKDVEPGDLILAVGKIKEYNREIYISGEVIKKLEDPNYESLRKLEVLDELLERKKIIDDIKKLDMPEVELREYVKNKFNIDSECLEVILENLKVSKEIDYKPKILEIIDSLDEGEGAEISKIFEISDLPENIIEKTINELMSSGVLFEPVPGVLKKA